MPILSKKRKKRYKITRLQEEILKSMPKDYRSKSALRDFLGKNYAEISDAVDILKDRGLILQKGERQGRGKKEKFYILTDEGIEQIIKFKIPLEDFWNLVFFVFDEESGHDLKRITVDSAFSTYEKDVLMLSREYSTPLYDWAISYFQYLRKDSARLAPVVAILSILVRNKPLTIKQIFQKMRSSNNEHFRYYSTRTDDLPYIKNMTKYLLITNTKNRYKLSHFGILLLLSELPRKNSITREVLNDNDVKEIIRDIRINYREFFPLIFENWNVLSRILSEDTLINTFSMVLNIKNSLYSSEPLQNGGLSELFNILKSMRGIHQNKIEKLLEAGKIIRDKWANKSQENYLRIHSRQTDIQIHFIQHKLTELSLPNSTDAVISKIIELVGEVVSYDLHTAAKMEMTEYFLSEIYSRKINKNSLVDLITFLFYTMIKYQIEFRLDMLWHVTVSSKELQEAKKEIDKINSNWHVFLEKNTTFVKSYSNWIETIVEFESQNMNLMKGINLSIEPSRERRENNLYFGRKMVERKSRTRNTL